MVSIAEQGDRVNQREKQSDDMKPPLNSKHRRSEGSRDAQGSEEKGAKREAESRQKQETTGWRLGNTGEKPRELGREIEKHKTYSYNSEGKSLSKQLGK